MQDKLLVADASGWTKSMDYSKTFSFPLHNAPPEGAMKLPFCSSLYTCPSRRYAILPESNFSDSGRKTFCSHLHALSDDYTVLPESVSGRKHENYCNKLCIFGTHLCLLWGSWLFCWRPFSSCCFLLNGRLLGSRKPSITIAV